jgi:branched-chain amino acid transport system ATP-binding protein
MASVRGNAPILRLSNVEVVYNDVILVLRGVSLAVPEGGVVALLGANGAGKTTLLRAVSGLLKIHRGVVTKGTIELDGDDIHHLDPADIVRRGVSQVMEGRRIFAELTVDENLRVGSLFRGKVGKDEFDRVYDIFPRIAERKNNAAHTLSGGERQMLVIGRALLAQPRILLLDEPSLGLAPRIVAQIFGLLRQLVDREGLSVLLVEQNARSALSVADVGVVLNLGKVVVTDQARTLMTDEGLRHAYLGF